MPATRIDDTLDQMPTYGLMREYDDWGGVIAVQPVVMCRLPFTITGRTLYRAVPVGPRHWLSLN